MGLVRRDAQSVHRTLTANVPSAGRPSAHASQQLDRRDLSDLFRREPAVALARLHSETVAGGLNSFMALLGMLSIVVNNAIVMLEQIDLERGGGLAAYEAIVTAHGQEAALLDLLCSSMWPPNSGKKTTTRRNSHQLKGAGQL